MWKYSEHVVARSSPKTAQIFLAMESRKHQWKWHDVPSKATAPRFGPDEKDNWLYKTQKKEKENRLMLPTYDDCMCMNVGRACVSASPTQTKLIWRIPSADYMFFRVLYTPVSYTFHLGFHFKCASFWCVSIDKIISLHSGPSDPAHMSWASMENVMQNLNRIEYTRIHHELDSCFVCVHETSLTSRTPYFGVHLRNA